MTFLRPPAPRSLARAGALALALGVALTASAACSGGSPTDGAGGTTTAPSTTAPIAPAPRPEAEPAFPEPVYPRTNDPPDPLAQRLCDAIHTLPARRKAECCKGEPSVTMVDECVRTLSYALRSKAVTLDPAEVDVCAEAAAKAFDGCGWVTPLSAAVPAACAGIVKGAVKEGDHCRSSLECQDGLHCHGVAASDTGRCGKPREAGSCSRGIDTLASHTRQSGVDRSHPECAGHCNGRRCEPDLPVGAACITSVACGAGRLCLDKKCSDTKLPAAGQKCLQGACGEGARCLSGTCVAPRREGESCADDIECPGVCDKAPGAPKGTCAMLCAARIPASIPQK